MDIVYENCELEKQLCSHLYVLHFILSGEMYVVMKNAGLSTKELNFKVQLEKDIEEAKSKLQRNESEFTNEKNRLQTDIGKIKDLNTKLENEKKTLGDKCKKLETENNNLVNENKSTKEDKKSLESQISKLNAELSSKSTRYLN